MPLPERPKPSRFATGAMLLALLLCFCLPRMVVVCTGPHAAPRLEWVHGGDGCGGCSCDHGVDPSKAERSEHGAGAPKRCCDDGGSCTDRLLSFELDKQPDRSPQKPQAPVSIPCACECEPRTAVAGNPSPSPLCTGPPRVDDRTTLRRTIELQV